MRRVHVGVSLCSEAHTRKKPQIKRRCAMRAWQIKFLLLLFFLILIANQLNSCITYLYLYGNNWALYTERGLSIGWNSNDLSSGLLDRKLVVLSLFIYLCFLIFTNMHQSVCVWVRCYHTSCRQLLSVDDFCSIFLSWWLLYTPTHHWKSSPKKERKRALKKNRSVHTYTEVWHLQLWQGFVCVCQGWDNDSNVTNRKARVLIWSFKGENMTIYRISIKRQT